jgi:PQQ-like domain
MKNGLCVVMLAVFLAAGYGLAATRLPEVVADSNQILDLSIGDRFGVAVWGDQRVTAFSLESGNLIATLSTEQGATGGRSKTRSVSVVSANGGRVAVTTAPDYLRKQVEVYNATNWRRLFPLRDEKLVVSDLLGFSSDGTEMYYTAWPGGELVAVDANTGQQRWVLKHAKYDDSQDFKVSFGSHLVLSRYPAAVVCRTIDGKEQWRKSTANAVGNFQIPSQSPSGNQAVCFDGSTNTLMCLNVADGVPVWQLHLHNLSDVAAVSDDCTCIVLGEGEGDGYRAMSFPGAVAHPLHIKGYAEFQFLSGTSRLVAIPAFGEATPDATANTLKIRRASNDLLMIDLAKEMARETISISSK